MKKNISITEITAKETYNLRQLVMWPDKPLDFIKLKNDAKGIHFALCKNTKIVSVISLFIENDHAQFRKFATDVTEQGNGYGTALLSYLMDFATSKKIKTLWQQK